MNQLKEMHGMLIILFQYIKEEVELSESLILLAF